jgi:hypothetical protein
MGPKFPLIGSDIEYIEVDDLHSYLDEIFPKMLSR